MGDSIPHTVTIVTNGTALLGLGDILALSNPDPEIEPLLARAHGAAFAADGKGINNVLAFPGLFNRA